MSEHFDLVVIGAGSGEAVVDDALSHWRVAVVERADFGGTCLNRGCIPSKMFVHPADVAVLADDGPRLGVRSTAEGVDWTAVRDRVIGRVDAASRDGEETYAEKPHVTVLKGTARFTGERRLVVTLADGDVEVTADRVVLATGSHPVVPDIPGLADAGYLTSDDVMRTERLPARVGVLGGGYVGSEFAHVLASYGARVTQVDSAPMLLTNQDAEISERFTAAVRERWDVRLETSLERVSGTAPHTMHLSDGSSVEVDAILVAVGRKPSSDGLDLEHAGVEVSEDGRVVVDEHLRTTAEGVWALGDLSSDVPLKHVANADARVVHHNLLHPDDLRSADHDHVPNAVFAHPQVASVGLTEEQAREQGLDLAVGRREYAEVAFGWALQHDPDDDAAEAAGLVKLLADRRTGLLVGAHLIGEQAAILVQPLVQAMALGTPVRGLARAQYWIHPALTEVVENALIDLEQDLEAGPDNA
ncbi:mycothione reductase [Nocardioides lianchengensis]|uniref:Mycothione reductase n=1 Tax=Nocardioides lianchengensis TaxID=1045774 RepID=A0A1G6R7N2_9ACTN|nr:mycothione reductase [Nocardioides lianchengensis]NYG10332.1 mycothione reductase [Nocardioides lianchengensis]SDD00642.1 mycothione reductase [Nocardioides lianchengensis]